MNKVTKKIIDQNPYKGNSQTMEQLQFIMQCVYDTKDIPGDIVELGCARGHTSVYLQRMIDELKLNKKLHLYDSFQGLPAKVPGKDYDDSIFGEGNFNDISMGDVYALFEAENLKKPLIHSGWFKDKTYPDQISFAFLDGDFYSSIHDSLEMVYPKMAEGGLVLIHDYQWFQLSGVEQACLDYFGTIDHIENKYGMGLIRCHS